jgi:hypothetical protein
VLSGKSRKLLSKVLSIFGIIGFSEVFVQKTRRP